MEKNLQKLSSIITLILIYVFGAYAYLSAKGFVYENGTITLVQAANASEAPKAFVEPVNANVNLAPSNQPILGQTDAPLTLYEYSSLGCGHCADFHLNILPRLKKEFIDTGKLNVVFVNFPLEKKSMKGAMLFECIPADYRHNFLNSAFTNQRDWMLSFKSDQILSGYAKESGLNATAIEECLNNDQLAQDIISARQEAINQLKIEGTPAFVISGKGQKGIIYGVPDYDQLVSYLNERLAN